MTTALERRLQALENASGGDGGCERCRGVLTVIRSIATGEIHSASWNSETLAEDEVRERQEETRCPRCGRDLAGDQEAVIKVGDQRRAGRRYGA